MGNELDKIAWYLGQPRECSYLEKQEAQDVFCQNDDISPLSYEVLLANGFRRSGNIIYRPNCDNCRACQPLRIQANSFKPSKSQRRVLRSNKDLTLTWGELSDNDEHLELYELYQQSQHQGQMSCKKDDFMVMFSHQGIDVREMRICLEDRLIGVGIVDVGPTSLSSVYFYFDPEFRSRSLGTYSIIQEILACQQNGWYYWYAGFYIKECQKMEYKGRFGPAEVLTDIGWMPFTPN
ncbi:MAG: arginyltransferase [Planctomycetes bacterium]|nr:arginyltransferase [Planctomycetota bacterium]